MSADKTVKRHARAWLLTFGVLALCGCQHDPYADWFMTREIADSALVGSYHMTRETLEHFASRDLSFLKGRRLNLDRNAKIVLTNDHKIAVSQVPVGWETESGLDICLLNSVGSWKLAKHQEFTAVRMLLDKPTSSRRGCPNSTFGFDMELFDDSVAPWHPAHTYPLLHLTAGDPDSGDALQFEKD